MASFSVDITDIVFAGGRTGSKIITLSNAPAKGVTVYVRGTNPTAFSAGVVTGISVYRVSTKQVTNTTKTAYVRLENNDDVNDYVNINLTQYGLDTDSNVYVNGNLINSSTPVNVGKDSGSVKVLIDTSYNVSSSVTSGSDWLSSVIDNPSITDTGFTSYDISYTANHSSERTGQVQYTVNETSQTITVVQEDGTTEPTLTVSPSTKNVSNTSGTVDVTVTTTDISDVSYSISVDWISYPSKSGDVYTFGYGKNTTTSQRQGVITFSGGGLSKTFTLIQSAGEVPPTPEPSTPSSLRSSTSKLRFYSEGSSKTVSFNYIPEGGIDSTTVYTDGTGWLTVENSGDTKKVTATSNTGKARRAKITFYDHNDINNSVVVDVIQGSSTYYESIWMDKLYYPENRDDNNNYYYRITNNTKGSEVFRGISAQPEGFDGGIDIPRIVESQIYSDFSISDSWTPMDDGYIEASVINMTTNDTDATFKYWNDWSRFEQRYDYTRYLNDPINGKGCKGMVIPVCVYYDDVVVFSYIENGSKTTFDAPTKPFVMCVKSFDSDKIDFKQGNDIVFSYDLSYCGEGALIYRNRFGGWDSFLIEGNIIKTDNYTKENYKQQSYINSSHYINEKVTDKVDITTTYEIHTGWLTDEESERLVYHLLSSPTVYFQNLKQEQFPTNDIVDEVNITNTSSEYKRFRNGKKLVNYTITFEVSNTQKVRR